MRVLHVVATYLPAVRYGGTIVSVHGLCTALATRGHDVHVFTTSVNGPHDSDVPHGVPVDIDGVHVRYFRSRYLRRLYWSPPLAAALATDGRGFDLVHTHAVFLWPLWAAARQARRDGVPYVMSPRGMLEKHLIERKSRLLKVAWISLIERRNLEGAAAIHVTSGREALEAEAFGFELPTVWEIPNGVDCDPDAGAPAPLPPRLAALVKSGPYVLFLGRVNWKKGIDRLIRAMPYLSSDFQVVVAGNDDERLRPSLEAEAVRLNVSQRLSFTGAVAGEEKRALLSNAGLVVLPSYSENFGNVVLEAMAAGRAVVVTPEVGIANVVRDNGVGLVVDGAPAVLGTAITDLMNDAATRDAMGERGRRIAAEQFTWEAVAARMEAAYESVLAGRRPPV